MKDYTLYDTDLFLDKFFPLVVVKHDVSDRGSAFDRHWHSQLEIIVVLDGKGTIECDSNIFQVKPGDTFIINSNQMHWMSCSEVPFSYYYIIVDTSLLKSDCNGSCEQRYITPIFNSLILFENYIPDTSPVSACFKELISEFERMEIGYELYIKSLIYKSLSLLLRGNVDRVMTQKELEIKLRSLTRLKKVIEYIDKHYAEDIDVNYLVSISCFSFYHFYHIFKKLTGKTVSEYINCLRIEKAENLLKNTEMQIIDIAMATGFNNTNYFCRTFRKFRGLSPTEVRKFY